MTIPPRFPVFGGTHLCHHIGTRIGERAAPGRSPMLVGDNSQLITLARQSQHGQQKILATHAIDPTGAKNQERNPGSLQQLNSPQPLGDWHER